MAQVVKVFESRTPRELEEEINSALAETPGEIIHASFGIEPEGVGALLVLRTATD